jgi:thioredoxin 1
MILAGCGLTGGKEVAQDVSREDHAKGMTDALAAEPLEQVGDSHGRSASSPMAASGSESTPPETTGAIPDPPMSTMPEMTVPRISPVGMTTELRDPQAGRDAATSLEQQTAARSSADRIPKQTATTGTENDANASRETAVKRRASQSSAEAPRREAARGGRVEKIGADQFRRVVLESDVPVIVDFYADWCKPCKQLSPLLDQIAREQAGLRVVKVDIDADKALASKYRVQAIPTIMVFRDGKRIARHTGLPEIHKALAR